MYIQLGMDIQVDVHIQVGLDIEVNMHIQIGKWVWTCFQVGMHI